MKLDGWSAYASSRTSPTKKSDTSDIEYFNFFSEKQELAELILSSDAILISIPPSGKRDPVLDSYGDIFREKLKARWIGYLSATSVYGDYGGAWVNEDSSLKPKTNRGLNRKSVEEKWRKLGISLELPIMRFRISGIYGPRRSPFDRIRKGKQKIIKKPGHVFNRVHIDDLCGILYETIKAPSPGEVFNISDSHPSNTEEFINEATNLLGFSGIEKIDIEKANLSETALSFYSDSKKVSNRKIVQNLKYIFRYPSYKYGLKSIIKEES